jgi:hypothetical protein
MCISCLSRLANSSSPIYSLAGVSADDGNCWRSANSALEKVSSCLESAYKVVSYFTRPKFLTFHPPFCPVYVLHDGLQGSGLCPNKWVRQSRCALYLGRPVALVLSLLTGYVSAQFHLKHDSFFEIVRDFNVLPKSKWQELARFTTEELEGKPIKKFLALSRDPTRRSRGNHIIP